MIFQQVRIAWKSGGRKRLVEFVMQQEGRANLVRAALLRTPDDLAAFERDLSRLSK